MQGNLGISSPDIIYSSDDEFPAILNLVEYIPEMKAVGSVQAEVTILGTGGTTDTLLTWEFAVTVPAGYQRTGTPIALHGYPFTCTVGGG